MNDNPTESTVLCEHRTAAIRDERVPAWWYDEHPELECARCFVEDMAR